MNLEEVRVLDLTRLLPGPYGTQLLADMGAEVVTIKRPAHHRDGADIPSLDAVHCGKESVTINLKHEDGREAFLRLAEKADVVVEQFRPGVVDELGIGYDDVCTQTPDIVYCSLSGYGQTGPYRNRVGHDLNYVALAGLLDMTRKSGHDDPVIPGYPIADMAGGVFLALSVVGALLSREFGNGGEYIDLSMMEAIASFSQAVTAEAFAGGDPRPGATILTGQYPCYDIYETADGRYVTIAAIEPKFWENLCHALNRENLVEKHLAPDKEVRSAVRTELATIFRQKTQAEWEEELGDMDVMFAPVRTPQELLTDPHLQARRAKRDITSSTARFRYPAHSTDGLGIGDESVPEAGEHTEGYLLEAGYTKAEIGTLQDNEVI